MNMEKSSSDFPPAPPEQYRIAQAVTTETGRFNGIGSLFIFQIIGVESRTSSPVRIPRDKTILQQPQIVNLFPYGDGAGYAGDIVSAAMDGEWNRNRALTIFASGLWV